MYLRPDDLLKYGSCWEGYVFMKRYFPDGGELVDIMQHKYMIPAFLHFGFDHFDSNNEEKTLYYKLLNINCENLASICHSENVSNSYCVVASEDIYNCDHIEESEDIEGSSYVSDSETVEHSTKVDSSSFVYDSCEVIKGQNITNSHNIVDCIYVVDSSSIIDSHNITESKWIRNSHSLDDCFFCADCKDLAHGLFCQNISGEYMLFNHPIQPKQFEAIKKQLLVLLGEWEMKLADCWVTDRIDWQAPQKNLNYITQYAAAPQKLWNWLATLPGYDPMTLYGITFQPHLLEE
jgi:hypothetical protein